MQKYRDTVTDGSGNAILSSTVTITDNSGGGVSTIYSDDGVTAKANPFTASGVDGVYEFYAANGRYDITIAATGFDTEQILDIVLNDHADSISSVDINGGTIDNTVIGGTSAASGTFTTLTVNGNTTLGDASGDTITTNAGTLTLTNNVSVTGTWTDLGIVTTMDLNGGSIDGATIGGTTPRSATFTTLTANGNTVIGNASGDTITTHAGTLTLTNNVSVTGTWADLGIVTTIDLNGGTIDGTVIGASSAAAGTFTALTSTGIDDNASALVVTLDNNSTAGNTRVLLYDVDAGTAQRVRVGANNTGPGGSGRALYFSNT